MSIYFGNCSFFCTFKIFLTLFKTKKSNVLKNLKKISTYMKTIYSECKISYVPIHVSQITRNKTL